MEQAADLAEDHLERGPFAVYILTNDRHTVLYVGMTSELFRRADQHRQRLIAGFTQRYRVTQLVYFELHPHAWSAIEREKQLKAGSRQRKLDLVNSRNPEWRDLYPDLLEEPE
jgi:putative endonuclease